MKKSYKADEMEMSINLKAVRLSWVYSSVFLVGWILYDLIKNGYSNEIASVLLLSQLTVFWATHIFLKWKLGKDEE